MNNAYQLYRYTNPLTGEIKELIPTGLIIPIVFSIDKPPYKATIELFFALMPEKGHYKNSRSERTWLAAENIYRMHHAYGEHQYLIPARHEFIDSITLPSGTIFLTNKYAVKQIENNPTTAVLGQSLELRPCNQAEFDALQMARHKPFFIEITKDSFYLHVWDAGRYWKIPSQRHTPMEWSPIFCCRAFPEITMEVAGDNFPVDFINLRDIPYSAIAQHLGREMMSPSGCLAA